MGYQKFYISKNDYLIAEGELPIALVAHLDIVYPNPPKKTEIYEVEKGFFTSDHGLGADDRAGVLGIATLINKGYRPHIMFFLGEEVGGVGAFNFCMKYQNLPFEVRCFIELDRHGVDQAVFYQCNNKHFQNYICTFGFTKEKGLFSDICILMDAYNTAGCNLSIGYNLEHTPEEYFWIEWFNSTIEKVERILDYSRTMLHYRHI